MIGFPKTRGLDSATVRGTLEIMQFFPMVPFCYAWLAISLLLPSRAETLPQVPFPAHSAYPGAAIRVSNFSQAQQDSDVRAAYDDWKASYVIQLTTTPVQYRIAFGKRNPNQSKTVSEGQGYGMVITALMAGYDPQAKEIFDGLWAFSRAHPSVVDARLMAWQVPTAKGDDADSAFDGDADIAYALLLADRQWGSGGTVEYMARAREVIAGIKASTIGTQSHLPLLGDWVGASRNSGKYTQWQTRSSDWMPGHFRSWGRATGDDSWSVVVTTIQDAGTKLQTDSSPTTGLLSDFIVSNIRSPFTPKPAGANFLEDKNDGNFYYNACRDPWRIGTDAILNNDATSLAQSRKLSTWIEKATGGNPRKIRAGYKLDGTPVTGSNYFTSVFVAPLGVAAMTSASQQKWLNGIYSAVRGARENYYEDSVTLLCLIVMSGNFWDPVP